MHAIEPLEMLLPGTWQLAFAEKDTTTNPTGLGTYTFKLAGTFNAEVRDTYSGTATWHGYWHVVDARLVLQAQEVSSRCNSCLDSGTAYHWTLELEQVSETTFTGQLRRDDDIQTVIFERV